MGSHGEFSKYSMPTIRRGAHVIVCGNEKGGSGKTTTCMHVIVALLKSGCSVATIDLDTRQRSLTRYLQNRKDWAQSRNFELELPTHYRFDLSEADSQAEAKSRDYSALERVISQVEHDHDFIIIDTAGSDSYLMRLAHSVADTLITPMNDSFVDFDVLAKVDPHSMEIIDVSHYALTVREARRQKRTIGKGLLDWVVVRNRMSPLKSRNRENLMRSVNDLSLRLGYRIAEGISERVIYREYFPMGLTALDDVSKLCGLERIPTSHSSAKNEISYLINKLRLPIDVKGKKRAEARKTWLERADLPMQMPDIFAE